MFDECCHCHQPKTEAELKICARCRSVAYCSLQCQVDSWSNGHESVCRLKSSFEDEIPLEAKDQSWTHQFLVVRDYLRDRCGVDSKSLKLLASDQELVKELSAQITDHLNRCKLKQSEIALATSSSSCASRCRSRSELSYASKSVAKENLPLTAADALKDLCDSRRVLDIPAISLDSPHPPPDSPPLPLFCAVRDGISSLRRETNHVLIKTTKINQQNLLAKQQVHRATKAISACSSLPVDVVAKAKQLKSSQSVISSMGKKGKDYLHQIRDSKAILDRAGFTEDIAHENILADVDAMREKQAAMEDIRDRVEAYHGLPADIALAKVALCDKKRTLSELGENAEGAMAAAGQLSK